MKFKSVAAALLAAVTCVSMAACGSGGDTNADGKVEITMWHNSTTGDGKAYWESAAKAFEKENPNVTIKIEAIQNEDMDGKLQTALQDPNSAPDIFMARGGQKLRDVVEAGQAMDLTDKISDTVKNQMATAEATGTIDGKIYSVQQSVLPGGIWYSKDLFEKAGITETPKTWDEFKTVVQKLKDAGIGTYILFQETYHKQSYLKLHPAGPKHDYDYHTEAMDRAMDGGIDDVGLGVLFGLEMYKYEFAGLLMHAEHLEAVHGVGPHTISVPRIKRADDIDPDVFDNGLSDELFAKVIACIRIAVPYTGMIISTRESQQVRERALGLGISQISGASRTSVGGYEEEERPHDSEQFDVSDQRSLDEVVHWLMQLGFIPSFCTACYREGRTGDRFMSLCKNGQILNCCHPNALMTLAEYLVDYASEDTRRVGMELIQEELKKIPRDKVREIAAEHIKDICSSNRRDFRF